MKESAARTPPKPAVVSLAQLLTEQPAAPPPGWIEPGLLPPEGILFVGGEPKVGKSLLVANLALALAAGKDRAGFRIPAARRVLVCQFELPTPQFVARLASMRRSVGAAADQNLLVDTRAGGNLLSAPQGLNHFLHAARQAAAEVIVLDPGAQATAETPRHAHQVVVIQVLIGTAELTPPHAEAASRLAHGEVGVQDHPIDAIIPTVQKLTVKSAQLVGHWGFLRIADSFFG